MFIIGKVWRYMKYYTQFIFQHIQKTKTKFNLQFIIRITFLNIYFYLFKR